MRPLICLCLLVAALGLQPASAPVLAAPAPAPATPAVASGKIVYQRGGDIYVMNPDGSSPASRLDGDPATGNHPKFSPDGSKIAFEGDFGETTNRLWIMDPDGGNQLKLTDLVLNHATLLWSPFSDLIMFQSITQTYTIRKDGTGLALIPNWPVGYVPSSWTANGNRILAYAQIGTYYQVYALNPDGTNIVNISNVAAHETQAHWSPDGTRVVYQSQRTGRYEIWAMNANGSNPVQLTDTPNSKWSIYPRVSPDGNQIVFSSDRNGGNYDIFVMDSPYAARRTG